MKGVSAKVFLSFEKDYQNGQLAQQTFFLLLFLSIYFPTLTWEMKSGVRSIPFFHMFKGRIELVLYSELDKRLLGVFLFSENGP